MADTIINAKAFEAFPCYDFGADGYWLIADVQVECYTPEHARIEMIAWLGICAYPIGWTATVALLLFVARKPISDRSTKATALSQALSFVYKEYEPLYFWWELCEMFRRFFLVGLLSIVSPGSAKQLVIATLFCMLYLFIQQQAQPFLSAADDYLALCDSLSLAMLYLCCLILKLKTLTETDEVYDVMSPKLRELFDVPVTAISAIMLASVVGSLVFCGMIFLLQMRAEQRRRQYETRAEMARRLRHRSDGTEVIPPLMTQGRYHLFLSHTWAHVRRVANTE